jgi:membrane fusion protein, copper/silver efflux system
MSANRKTIILGSVGLLALVVAAAIYIAPRWLNTQGHSEHAPVAQDPHAAHGLQEREVLYWYDPMHPEYRSDKPGIAPDCGMQLVPRYADEVEAVKDAPPGTVMISAQRQQLIGVRTAPVRRELMQRTIRTVGRVTADETRLAHIHVKVPGWAENVYVDFVGKLVRKGEPLFTLYSPDLVSTQREYLLARRGVEELGGSAYPEVARAAHSMLRAAQERLRLWDISEAQIEHLQKTGEVTRTMTIYSPINGFVLNRTIFPQAYLTPEMRLYELADLSRVWVDADVYEYEVPFVQLNMPARVSLSHQPGRTWQGRVAYLYPSMDAASGGGGGAPCGCAWSWPIPACN